MVKDIFKLYGFMLLVLFGAILFLATTIGPFVAAIILCVIFKTGMWVLLWLVPLFAGPLWYSMFTVAKEYEKTKI